MSVFFFVYNRFWSVNGLWEAIFSRLKVSAGACRYAQFDERFKSGRKDGGRLGKRSF